MAATGLAFDGEAASPQVLLMPKSGIEGTGTGQLTGQVIDFDQHLMGMASQ